MVKGDDIIERLLAAEVCIVNLTISLPSFVIEVGFIICLLYTSDAADE